MMPKIRQSDIESVQLFMEHLLQIAEYAYDPNRIMDPLILQQFVDIFCDGLTYDNLRMKILLVNLRTL